MKILLTLIPCCLASLSAIAATSSTEYTFTKVKAKPGEKIRMVSHMESVESTIQKQLNGLLTSGTITASRDLDLTWTFRQPDEDGTLRAMCNVHNFTHSITTTFAGKSSTEETPSPLIDKLIEMTKPKGREWKFNLDGSVPFYRIESETELLGLYLKRSWFPDYPVKLGDSWEFDPTLIYALVVKEFKKTKAIGTMRLRQIKHTESASIATIDVSIRAAGSKYSKDGVAKDSMIQLDGPLVLNLSTMLEESIDLKGSVQTTVTTGIDQFETTLPVTLKVSKSFVR